MQLNVLTASPETPVEAPPLVIAHGLFGSARNWNAIARKLGERRRVLAADMRNHGDSPDAEANGYADMAGDLAELIVKEGPPADLLGHSMGGKAAMVLALTQPEAVRRLIVADIAPAAYTHSHSPYIEALQAVDLSEVRRRSHADAQLADAIPDRGMRAFLLQSLAVGPEGARWKLNLDALAASLSEIMDFPADLMDRSFDGPALFLTGADSDYVREEHRETVLRLFPNAEHKAIPNAGHWLHADQPQAFIDAVTAFLEA